MKFNFSGILFKIDSILLDNPARIWNEQSDGPPVVTTSCMPVRNAFRLDVMCAKYSFRARSINFSLIIAQTSMKGNIIQCFWSKMLTLYVCAIYILWTQHSDLCRECWDLNNIRKTCFLLTLKWRITYSDTEFTYSDTEFTYSGETR